MNRPGGSGPVSGADRTALLDISIEDGAWLERAETAWAELLEHSSADRLFMSWGWQHLWWRQFGPMLGAEPLLLVARAADGRLVGIAPLMCRRARARRLFPATQLMPIGNVWRTGVGEVSEHIDWLAREGWEERTGDAFARRIIALPDWHEFLFAYTDPGTLLARTAGRIATELGCYVRAEAPLRRYTIDTTRSFADFIAGLGSATRRQLFGRRQLLAGLGEFRCRIADRGTLDVQLDMLEALSIKRWNVGLTPEMRAFYRGFAEHCLDRNALRFSTLEVGGRPISAQFDAIAGAVTYNIRSAIDAEFDHRLSPGLLHLGYNIEAACADPRIVRYDLLAGEGKQTDFKRHIADRIDEFTSGQIIRRRHEKLLYRIYDALGGSG